MAVEYAVRARLKAVTAITNIVGNRIYPNLLPQDVTLEAITYRKVSAPHVHAFGSDAGLSNPRFQIDAWADVYTEVITLAAAIQAGLSRFRGTIAGEVIQDVMLLNELDIYEQDRRIHRVMMDFEVWHTE